MPERAFRPAKTAARIFPAAVDLCSAITAATVTVGMSTVAVRMVVMVTQNFETPE